MLYGRVQDRIQIFHFEDTPMAVTKKSIADNSPAAKTTPTKSPKASSTAKVEQSTMKTTMMRTRF